MKLIITVVFSLFFTQTLFANDTWDKAKSAINEGAEKIDEGTRKIIKKGKKKLKEREERKAREEQKEKQEKK